ncbi:hypothetical protein [Methylobacterium nodulans]|uniref:Helicase A859L n=1 Tax=Methylobacterium nodulans (strain LMG 21967 / CNCM I-2342 / ORS 2060) TaxID=460265 RepID=B8IAM1_METNO|nr:hypothetical protein [Methylobacterium nodulans]ACL61066.1 hypothetical protein Mnod_6261 [Methylobacterium nodulans ORS 2060]
MTHEEVEARVREIHEGTITLLGRFTTSMDRIEARCEGCGGVWRPTATRLLQGHGCGHCNRKGYSPLLPAWLYCFRFASPDGIPLFKVGVTNRDPLKRYELPERQRMALCWSRLFDTGALARDAERQLLQDHAGLRYRGPTGFSFSDAEVLLADPMA